jgi:hypothetical protein
MALDNKLIQFCRSSGYRHMPMVSKEDYFLLLAC